MVVIGLWILSPVDAEQELQFFSSEEAVEFRLEIPVRKLKKQRGEDPEWMEGQLVQTTTDGSELRFDISIKARGNFRRLESSCSFPSYWINFKKKQVPGTLFEGLDRVKVVSHCRETRKSFEPYIYKEYLTYKTYNLITENSFRTRLARIQYIDSERDRDEGTFAAFLIEPVEHLAGRLGGELVTERYVLPSLYDPFTVLRADFFQYMVGNTDYSLFSSIDECCHNGKAFALPDGYIAVPYDFDMSGIVNTPYAVPNPSLKIDSVRERYFRGIKTTDYVFNQVLGEYLKVKQEILTLWRDTPLLSDKDKDKAISYINDFYRTLGNPILLATNIKRKMRNLDRIEESILSRIEQTED